MDTSSPGYWSARYATGDTPWDKGAPAPPVIEIIARGFVSGRTFVPGCGPGHDCRALAAVPGVTVTGLDIVPQAVETARRLHAGTPGMEFVAGDLFALPETFAGAFDTVVEHTCLCAIPPSMRAAYAKAVARVLKPGGIFAAVLFVNPDTEDGPPFGITPAEADALFRDDFEPVAAWSPASAFPGREGRERVRVGRRR